MQFEADSLSTVLIRPGDEGRAGSISMLGRTDASLLPGGGAGIFGRVENLADAGVVMPITFWRVVTDISNFIFNFPLLLQICSVTIL